MIRFPEIVVVAGTPPAAFEGSCAEEEEGRNIVSNKLKEVKANKVSMERAKSVEKSFSSMWQFGFSFVTRENFTEEERSFDNSN